MSESGTGSDRNDKGLDRASVAEFETIGDRRGPRSPRIRRNKGRKLTRNWRAVGCYLPLKVDVPSSTNQVVASRSGTELRKSESDSE